MKPAKKVRTGSGNSAEENIAEIAEPVMDVASIHEVVLTRVNEALSIFKPANEKEADSLTKAIPIIATAVSVAVGEVMRTMMMEVEERLRPMSSPKEERLFSAVRTLTYENDRLQQYSRRESIRISGFPSVKGETAEDVEGKALKLFSDVGAKVKKEDIAVAHRAGKETEGSRPILVRFVSRRTRNEVMSKKKNLKDKKGCSKLYINDDLTPLRARLLGYVKRLDFIHRAWTIDGRIHCLKKFPPGLAPEDRPKPQVVETPDDLFRLGVQTVDYRALGLHHLAEDSDHAPY